MNSFSCDASLSACLWVWNSRAHVATDHDYKLHALTIKCIPSTYYIIIVINQCPRFVYSIVGAHTSQYGIMI